MKLELPIKSLIYLSPGNLPSQMAHTVQIAKMAQVLSQKIKEFELVTSGDFFSAWKGIDAEFKSWYGLDRDFKLVRLPIHLKVNTPFPKNYYNQYYFKLAVLYACLKSPSLVYTRSLVIVDLLLKIGLPVFWEWHEPIDKDSPHCKFLNNKNLIGVVTLSPRLAENYIQLGLDHNKVLVTHSAVELKNFLPYQEKDIARQKLSLPQDAKIVLYSGHLYEYKGISTIIETACLMPECQFVLVGGWIDDVNRVKAACQEKELHNVHIVGHVAQSELTSYLYAADILLVPTSKSWNLAEVTSPLKLFEYMAVRRPIVASALSNITTVLRDQENALLAEPDKPLSFKEAIIKLLDNPSMANSLAECAFQEVQKFTWDSRTDSILDFAVERLEKIEYSQTNPRKKLLRYINGINSVLKMYWKNIFKTDKGIG
ncbi:glycosyltransferase [Calothrix sp. CCY 0018]|uniref:glycosyltransferase n=1 Tax=Calothrix sp. CCY 0018 TaxID=3103864 RepID=UPI0039C6A833